MWANLTPEAVDQIAHRSGDPLSLHAHHRGCTGLDEWSRLQNGRCSNSWAGDG